MFPNCQLNDVENFGRGDQFCFSATPEGLDVLRFFCVLYVVTPEATFNALRGGSVTWEEREKKAPVGIFDLRKMNLPGIPSGRTCRDCNSTPIPIQSAITDHPFEQDYRFERIDLLAFEFKYIA